jgi:hypothetical protein
MWVRIYTGINMVSFGHTARHGKKSDIFGYGMRFSLIAFEFISADLTLCKAFKAVFSLIGVIT